MMRLKLFLFYSAMAWASIARPAEGLKMIDAAERDAERAVQERLRADIHQNGRTLSAPQESDAPVGWAVAIGFTITAAWLAAIASWLWKAAS